MNKFSTFFKATLGVLRGLLVLLIVILPGVAAFIYWYVGRDVWLDLAISGALGVEFAWLIAVTIAALLRDAWKERSRRKLDDMEL